MRALRTLALVLLLGIGLMAAPSGASADPTWAPAATAAIHPGTMMYTEGAQCTANFVYTDGAGNTYVGYAAHCAGTGGSTDTNGCQTGSVPLGTPVDLTNDGNLASEGTVVGHGTLAYSSWITEHQLGTTDANTCAYNDLALVKIDPADVAKVNPSVPFWGGPTGIDTNGTAAGDRVWTYGNSSLRGGVELLSPKTGVSLGDSANDILHLSGDPNVNIETTKALTCDVRAGRRSTVATSKVTLAPRGDAQVNRDHAAEQPKLGPQPKSFESGGNAQT